MPNWNLFVHLNKIQFFSHNASLRFFLYTWFNLQMISFRTKNKPYLSYWNYEKYNSFISISIISNYFISEFQKKLFSTNRWLIDYDFVEYYTTWSNNDRTSKFPTKTELHISLSVTHHFHRGSISEKTYVCEEKLWYTSFLQISHSSNQQDAKRPSAPNSHRGLYHYPTRTIKCSTTAISSCSTLP